jgi:hypothetical protein
MPVGIGLKEKMLNQILFLRFVDRLQESVENMVDIFIRLRRRPRLRAETSSCTKRCCEGGHSGVQARALPVGLHQSLFSKKSEMIPT